MSHITLTVPPPITAPRGAVWAAALSYAALEAVSRAWRTSGEDQKGLRRGREAAALRRYADEVAATDPGFAADLYAAADRHFDRD